MMRRLIAVAAVLLLSGLMPLTAMAGFCAARPCCRTHTHGSTASLSTNPACCDETNCDTTAHSVEATGAKTSSVRPQLVATQVTVQHIAVAPAPGDGGDRIDTGPPRTRQRLATLSILLI